MEQHELMRKATAMGLVKESEGLLAPQEIMAITRIVESVGKYIDKSITVVEFRDVIQNSAREILAPKQERKVTTSKKPFCKFMVIDPCYITPRDEYDKMGKEYDWDLEDVETPRRVGEGLTIQAITGTATGDGKFGKVTVDSATLAVVMVESKELYEEHQDSAVSFSSLGEAVKRMHEIAAKI